MAAAAIERFGDDGLLRSVVVAPDHRGSGVGQALVAAAEALAREAGIRDLWLLTETAIDWFPRLGYEVVERADGRGGGRASRSSSRPSAATRASRCADRWPERERLRPWRTRVGQPGRARESSSPARSRQP